jgi:hypothetical protein
MHTVVSKTALSSIGERYGPLKLGLQSVIFLKDRENTICSVEGPSDNAASADAGLAAACFVVFVEKQVSFL